MSEPIGNHDSSDKGFDSSDSRSTEALRRAKNILDNEQNADFTVEDLSQIVEIVTDTVGKDQTGRDYEDDIYGELQKEWDERQKEAGGYKSNEIIDSENGITLTVTKLYSPPKSDDQPAIPYYQITAAESEGNSFIDSISWGGSSPNAEYSARRRLDQMKQNSHKQGTVFDSYLLNKPIDSAEIHSPLGVDPINLLTEVSSEDVRTACQKVFSLLPHA